MADRIRRITLTPVRVPIPVERVNCPAFAHETLNRKPTGEWGGPYFGDVPFYIIEVAGDGGPIGVGDTPRIVSSDVLRAIAPGVIGCKVDDLDARRSLVQSSWPRVGAPPAGADRQAYTMIYYKGLDTAVLDWAARQREVPLHRLFGQQVRQRVRCEYWSGFRTPAGAAAVARRARELGFLGLKLKANLELDVPGIAQAVRDVAGPDFKLNFDPNGRWETLENTLARVEPTVAVHPNVYFEDPVYGSAEIIAAVRRRTGCTTAITAKSVADVEQAVALDAADLFNCMGLWSMIPDIAAAAARAGKPVWLGSALESSVGDAASLHLAATIPNCTAGCDLMAHFMRDDDLVVTPIRYADGHADVPDGPGLGVELDRDALERYRCGEPIVIE